MMAGKHQTFQDFIVVREGLKPWIVPVSKIKDFVKQGLILGDDLLYRESLEIWTRARHVKGLRRLIQRLEAGSQTAETSEPSLPDDDFFPELMEESTETRADSPSSHPDLPPPESKDHTSTPPYPRDSSSSLFDQTILRLHQSRDKEEEETEKPIFKRVFPSSIGIVLVAMLVYWLYPANSTKIPVEEFIVGRVVLDKAPLPGGTVVAQTNGRELVAQITPTGNYTLKDPPKGLLRFKIHALAPPPDGLPSTPISKIPNGPSIPPRYLQYGNGLSLDYKGGVAVYDLIMQEK